MLKQKTIAAIKAKNIGKYLVPAGGILILYSIFLFFVVSSSQGYAKTYAVVTRTELYENIEESEDPEESEASDENLVNIDGIFDVFDNPRDKTSTVYVKYTVDGIEYEGVYGVTTGLKEGDKIQICYDPADPTIVAQPGSLAHPIVILAVGIAAIIAGIVCYRMDSDDSSPEAD